MGKIVTIYLSDDEARDLKEFCDESQCTQYSALKNAVKQILSKPMPREEEDVPEDIIDETPEDSVIGNEVVEESIEEPVEVEDTIEDSDDPLMRYLIRLRKKRSNR